MSEPIKVLVVFHAGDEVVIECAHHDCIEGVFRCYDDDGSTLFWTRADYIKYLAFDTEIEDE